jgi:UDP-N-acetylmuramate dehydrogenase
MTIRRTPHAPLRARNTFGIDAHARMLIETDNSNDLTALFAGELANAAALVLGGGSNLLIVEGPEIALALDTQSIRTLDTRDDIAIVRVDAGVQWHRLVMWSLDQGLAGLENLALIPGTVGAAPIQNIGAYGVEVGECIHAVEAFERTTGGAVRVRVSRQHVQARARSLSHHRCRIRAAHRAQRWHGGVESRLRRHS